MPYEDAGELELKNIAMPVRAYHVRAEAIAAVDPDSVAAVGAVPGDVPDPGRPAAVQPAVGARARPWRGIAAAVAVLALAGLGGAWWWRSKPAAAPPADMTVRLDGFKLLSGDLPKTLSDSIAAEITAAFNADGAVNVASSRTPAGGASPSFALGGTVQRVGDSIRVITNLTNERSGATVWGRTLDY